MPAKNLQSIDEEGLFLHIYNKGVENRLIFNDEEDYQVFLDYLKEYLTAPRNPESTKKTFQVHGRTFQGIPHQPKNYFDKVELIAYSLMPDHFHLLLHQKAKGSIESFIRSLCTRYSIYWNKKYARTGSLFQGPYKSAQIKNDIQLLHLTHYLHQGDKNTSYPEYLESRKTPWIKTEVVLSVLNKGVGGYKDFVEKKQLDQQELQLTDDLTFDSKTDHGEKILERSDLAIKEEIRTNPTVKIHSGMIEFVSVSTVMFVLLVTVSLRNIFIIEAKNYQPLSPPAVLSETEQVEPETSPKTENHSTPKAKPETEAKKVIVKSEDGFSKINIRQKPTTTSEKIAKAKDGDTFEFISLDSGWYEVKLTDDGSTGFISEKYVVMEKTK